jgi:hypothetical protein
MPHASLASLLLASALLAQAPPDVAAKILAEERDHPQVMALLDHLTNKIGPRLTGSQRLDKACEWARDRLKSFGLSTARLEKWGEVAVGFDRGVQKGSMFVADAQGALTAETELVFTTFAWTPGTKGEQRGKAVLAPAKDEIEAKAASFAKSWVLVKGEGSKELRRACEEHGAHGLIARNQGWGDPNLIITDGNMNTQWEKWPKLPLVRLLPEQWDDIHDRLEKQQKVELAFCIENKFKQGPVPLYNVLAELRGSERPDELVIVGGHIDSWDGATGTTDNGTGVATTLEAARLLMAAGAKPRRTIRFMLWSGEEQGLLGSEAYCKKHPEENPRISAVLVHDGGTDYVAGIGVLTEMLPAIEKAFAPVLAANDPEMPFAIREVPSLPWMIGSDQDTYVHLGVPGFFWDQKGGSNYTRTHHTQHDTFAAANAKYEQRSSVVIALGALGIANLPELLPRRKELARPSGGQRRLGVQLDGQMNVTSVGPGSKAEGAGLQAGDRILSVNGTPVASSEQLVAAINKKGEEKKVTVERDGKKVDFVVRYPDPAARAADAPASRPSEPKKPKGEE